MVDSVTPVVLRLGSLGLKVFTKVALHNCDVYSGNRTSLLGKMARANSPTKQTSPKCWFCREAGYLNRIETTLCVAGHKRVFFKMTSSLLLLLYPDHPILSAQISPGGIFQNCPKSWWRHQCVLQKSHKPLDSPVSFSVSRWMCLLIWKLLFQGLPEISI